MNTTINSKNRDNLITNSTDGTVDYGERELRDEIIQILISDPDSEVKELAEKYLIQCLYNAIEDQDKNPVLHKFFDSFRSEREKIRNELEELRFILHKFFDSFRSEREKIRNELEELRFRFNQEKQYYDSVKVEVRLQRLEYLLEVILDRVDGDK